MMQKFYHLQEHVIVKVHFIPDTPLMKKLNVGVGCIRNIQELLPLAANSMIKIIPLEGKP